ncbi:MAG: ornithine cyclodeaminase family protein [Deltaproteobacteria bacterium]|nr:ornithine cyclodeaminase family protein [Deltaproteobacteria bacterium]
MALLLTDNDVQQLLTMTDAIDVAELALRELHQDKAENRPRHQFYANSQPPDALFMMRHFQGAIPKLGVMGLRVTTDVIGTGAHKPELRSFGSFMLFDLNTAGLLAIFHDHELQRMRVGAETGVAARYLARADAKTVGLLGAGYQAETQLAAVCAVRPIEKVRVYSPTSSRRSDFAQRMSKQLGISMTPVESARQAVEEADLVLASTNASVPVLDGDWLKPGCHLTSIVNSDRKVPRRELDNRTFARASLVGLGSIEQSKQDHAADIFGAIDAGALFWEWVCEIGDVIVGKAPGRTDDRQITVYKNNGLAIEFVALAWKTFMLAQQRSLGEQVPAHYFSGRRTK